MKRFTCQRCRACCNNIQGNFREEEIKEFKLAFKKLESQGTYLAIEPEKFSIPLFPHEAKKMKELAYRIGIDFSPVPKIFMIDSKTGYSIILEWDLGYSDCPFFDGDKCLIYNYRPLTCQSFPIFPSFLLSSQEEYILLDRCPQSKRYRELNKDEIEGCFENEIKASLLFSKELNRYKTTIEELVEKQLITPLVLEKDRAIKMLRECERTNRIVDANEIYSILEKAIVEHSTYAVSLRNQIITTISYLLHL